MFHWQNLKEGKSRHWLHGRAWLGRWHCEWTVWNASFRIGLELDEAEGRAGLTFGCGLFRIYISRQFRIKRSGEFYLYLYDGALWFKLWGDDDWRSSDPWWKRGIAIHLDELLMGKAKYETETISEIDAFVPMPEGAYPAKVRIYQARWKYPRWFTKEITRAEIDVPSGIPSEGKGENSWDCGEDAIYSLTCPAHTVEQAIAKMVESVLRDRRRYGGAFTHRDRGVVLAKA